MNLEKAREVAFMIRKDEKHWDQGSWYGPPDSVADEDEWFVPVTDLLEFRCGSTGCVAGWAVALSHPGAVFHSWADVLQDGRLIGSVGDLARAGLGLTGDQALWLFSCSREKEEVLWALENEDPDWTPEDWYDQLEGV